MICITSRIGEMRAMKRSLRPARMPSGTPIRTAMTTAARVNASVSMAACQRPSTPNARKPPTISAANRQPPKMKPRAAMMAVTPVHPSEVRIPWKAATMPAMGPRTLASRKARTGLPWRLESIQARTSLRNWKNGALSSWGSRNWPRRTTKAMAAIASSPTAQACRDGRRAIGRVRATGAVAISRRPRRGRR